MGRTSVVAVEQLVALPLVAEHTQPVEQRTPLVVLDIDVVVRRKPLAALVVVRPLQPLCAPYTCHRNRKDRRGQTVPRP